MLKTIVLGQILLPVLSSSDMQWPPGLSKFAHTIIVNFDFSVLMVRDQLRKHAWCIEKNGFWSGKVKLDMKIARHVRQSAPDESFGPSCDYQQLAEGHHDRDVESMANMTLRRRFVANTVCNLKIVADTGECCFLFYDSMLLCFLLGWLFPTDVVAAEVFGISLQYYLIFAFIATLKSSVGRCWAFVVKQWASEMNTKLSAEGENVVTN